MNAKTVAAMRALGTATATPESDAAPESKPTPGFDGGARTPAPLPPESHEATLLRIIRREVTLPSDWPWPHG